MSLTFEWDAAKAAENYTKHGVTFAMAQMVFTDPFAVERADNRRNYGEERFTIFGMADGRLLFVVYTMRGETIRLISARGAEPYERRYYHEHNT